MKKNPLCPVKSASILLIFSFSLFLTADLFSQSYLNESKSLKVMDEAEALYRTGAYEEALRTLNEALALVRTKENLGRLYLQLSVVYYAAGNNIRAEEYIRKLYEIHPKSGIDKDRFPPGYADLFIRVGRDRDSEAETPKAIGSKGKRIADATSKKNKTWLYILAGVTVVGIIVAVLLHKKKKEKSQPEEPTSTTGNIRMESTPTGAKIYFDGSDTGKTTNDTITDVAPGNHTIWLFLAGYFDYRQNVSVKAGETLLVMPTLMAIQEPVMIRVPGGTFMMGSESSEAGPVEKPVHQVTISSFEIGKYEVTQAEWISVMGENPSLGYVGDRLPVQEVTWLDVQTYIQKLNAAKGKNFRLPTEAEWEYACRAGTTGDRYGDPLYSIAWYWDNSEKQIHEVGGLKPNGFGLYDMLGNVLEWCADWYGPYSAGTVTNPKGPTSGDKRICRGGHYSGPASIARASYRQPRDPSAKGVDIGFRLARD